MQSQVAERDYRDKSSNAEPVHGHGCVSFDVFAGCACALELQQGFARGGARGSTGFDVFESFEVAPFEFMLVDASGLDSRRAWSRPGNELSTRPENGQAEFRLETTDGGPISFENAERVSDHDFILVEADSWLDEEQPHGYSKKAQDGEDARQFVEASGNQGRNNGAESDNCGSDNCVSSEAWANDVHVANYPSETNGSHLKCEETK